MENMRLVDMAALIPPAPHGHIDNMVGPALRAMAARPVTDLAELATLQGLAARAWRLVNAPTIEHEPPPPTGGTPSAAVLPMALAA